MCLYIIECITVEHFCEVHTQTRDFVLDITALLKKTDTTEIITLTNQISTTKTQYSYKHIRRESVKGHNYPKKQSVCF
jgi:hypothetical protein